MSQYMEMSMDGPDEVMSRPPSLWRRRALVLSFYLNFCFSVLSIVLTGSLFDGVRQVLLRWLMGGGSPPAGTVAVGGPIHTLAISGSQTLTYLNTASTLNVVYIPSPPGWSMPLIWLMGMASAHPIPFLLIPLLSLIVLYIVLRYQARDTMLGPDRYLDERQKLVRDWAQRSAYRVIEWALLLAALGLFLHAVFSGSPEPDSTLAMVWRQPISSVINKFSIGPNYITFPLENISKPFVTSPYSNATWPVDPLHIALYYGTLLACIFLLLTVLPITIALWKKDPSRAAAGLK